VHDTVKHSLAEIQTGRKSGNGADGDLGPCQITVSLDSEVSNKFLLPLRRIIFSLDKVPFNGCKKKHTNGPPPPIPPPSEGEGKGEGEFTSGEI
jgi:hypothetical protein